MATRQRAEFFFGITTRLPGPFGGVIFLLGPKTRQLSALDHGN